VQLGNNSVVDYYNRAGRAVYVSAMDLSKAFDLVSWDVLFSELLERGVSALRCLMFIYSNQKSNVRWGNVLKYLQCTKWSQTRSSFFPCAILYIH